MSLAHIHFNKIQACLDTIVEYQDKLNNYVFYGDLSYKDNEMILDTFKTVIRLSKIRLDEIINEAKKELI
tara:strand:+ start:1654 stop:1863 length:210 start_codon:yes stop_codon:yes gene_type:complete